jgi:hypothetical protein
MIALFVDTSMVSAVIVAAIVTINVLFSKGYHGYCGYMYVPEVFYCANISCLITTYIHS